jgi:hypothetical protein
MSVMVFDAQRSIHMLCCYGYPLITHSTDEKKAGVTASPKGKWGGSFNGGAWREGNRKGREGYRGRVE